MKETPNLVFPQKEKLVSGILEHLGYRRQWPADPKVTEGIYRAIEICREVAQPKTVCRATSFRRVEQRVIHGDGLCIATANWANLTARMSGAREIFCFAITLGQGIDRQIRLLEEEGRMLDALLLDAAASSLAECHADQVQEFAVCKYREKGLAATARFSPGYCDWPLEAGQRMLFSFLGPESIGVLLSDSCLMTPRKTITAAIVAAERMPRESPCFMCAKDCPHRRSPFVAPDRRFVDRQ